VATEIAAIITNLRYFYEVADRTVIDVGAGGGQFVEFAARARHVLAVDPDGDAVATLRTALRQKGLEDRFQVVQSGFSDVSARADLVFFEFCLHEIPDPAAALHHALTLAPEVVVADHAPESQWSWLCGEEDKLVGSWTEVRRLQLVREARFQGVQRFRDYAELHAKLATAGEPTLQRIEAFRDQTDFSIPMPYRMALVARGARI